MKKPANDERPEMTAEEILREAERVRANFGRVHIARICRDLVIEKLHPGYARGTIGKFG